MSSNITNPQLDDLYKKYEDIFKNILVCLIEDNQENDVSLKLEKVLIDFDIISDSPNENIPE